jgi:hypothetical protein
MQGAAPPVSPPPASPVETAPPVVPPSTPNTNDMHTSDRKRGGGMFDFLHSSRKYFALAAIVMLAVAVPLTTYLAGQQQDARQRASTFSSCTGFRALFGLCGRQATPTLTPTPTPTLPDATIQQRILLLCKNNGYRSIPRANGGVFSFTTELICTNYFNQLKQTYGSSWRTTVCGWFPQACFENSPTPTVASVSATPTEGPTPTPIQTSSPDGTKLSVTVFLQGIGKAGDNVAPGQGGNQDPFRLQRPVTVELYDTSNVLRATASGVLLYSPTNGNFTGTIEPDKAVASGSYSARVIVPGYLAQNISQYFQVTPSATITLPKVTLITGDINQDNILSILDYNILLGCYSGITTAKDCDSLRMRLSDLNDDGRVDGLDYNLFLRTMAVQRGSGGAGYSTVNNNPPPSDPTATPTPTVVVTISPTTVELTPTTATTITTTISPSVSP